VTPSSVAVGYQGHPEDGGSNVFRNDGVLPQHYAASHPEDLDLNLHRRKNL